MEDTFRNKSVLIAGGLGFIGSNLARRLLEMGARITIVDSLLPDYGGNLANVADITDRVVINFSDLRDESSIGYLVRGHDYLFNLAGQTSHLDSMRQPQVDLEMNCRAQLAVLEACRNYNPDIKIVFASTRQIYGKPDYLPVDEKHPIRPVDINGINKIAGESYHMLYNKVYNLRSCALRLTNTYGPRMRIKDGRQTFVGVWIRALIEDKPIEVWEGSQLRDFNYVDDCAEALLWAGGLEATNGGVFNLGDHSPITLLDLAKLLIEINGRGTYLVKEFPPERKSIDIGDYYSDHSLFSATTGWQPRVGLRDGLGRTMTYFRNSFEKYI